jgi:hypothetical protein
MSWIVVPEIRFVIEAVRPEAAMAVTPENHGQEVLSVELPLFPVYINRHWEEPVGKVTVPVYINFRMPGIA